MKAIDLIRAEQYRYQQENNTRDSTGPLGHASLRSVLELTDEANEEVLLFLDSVELATPNPRHLIAAAARLAEAIDNLS